MKNIDIDIDKTILKDIDIAIDIDKDNLGNIDIDIEKDFLENIDIDIDIDKDYLENIDIDIDIDKDILGKKIIFSTDLRLFHAFLMKYRYRLSIYRHFLKYR